jgi:cytidylate kinase
MSVVTIRGQLGSGAPEIGKMVADKLHVDYVDREIIAQVAKRLEREEHDVIVKEMPPGTLLGRIVEALTSNYAVSGPYGEGAYLPPELIPLDDARYVEALESVLQELAKGPSLVIRGRGSQFVLKECPGSLHVMVVAPLDLRLERVMAELKLYREDAHREITSFDTSRHEFIKRYFQAELEDPLHYDLVINTRRLSLEAAVSNIVNAFRSRRGTRRKTGRTG